MKIVGGGGMCKEGAAIVHALLVAGGIPVSAEIIGCSGYKTLMHRLTQAAISEMRSMHAISGTLRDSSKNYSS